MTDPFDAFDPEKDTGQIDYGAEFNDLPIVEDDPSNPTDSPEAIEALMTSVFGAPPAEIGAQADPRTPVVDLIGKALAEGTPGFDLASTFGEAALTDWWNTNNLGSKPISDLTPPEVIVWAARSIAAAREGTRTPERIAADAQEAEEFENDTRNSPFGEGMSDKEFEAVVAGVRSGSFSELNAKTRETALPFRAR